MLATKRGLRGVYFNHQGPLACVPSPFIEQAEDELSRYFAGSHFGPFRTPLDIYGTPFQLQVLNLLQQVGPGETISYGEIAELCGGKAYARAVGGALGRNPLPIFIPCHRVVGKAGAPTGFAWGIEAKIRLLQLEERLYNTSRSTTRVCPTSG